MRLYAHSSIVCFLMLSCCLALCGGCARHKVDLNPQPLVSAPGAYSVEQAEATTADKDLVREGWWHAFGDVHLDGLVESALAENLTVSQALERVDRAGYLLHQARALRRPQVDFSAQGDRTRQREWTKDFEDTSSAIDADSLLTILEQSTGIAKQSSGGGGGSSSGGSSGGGGAIVNPTDSYTSEFSFGLGFTWELDLWGRLRSAANAQGQQLLAAVEDYEDLRLIVSALTVDAYFQAVEQRLRIELLEDQHEASQNILELLELRLLQGDASAVDVLQQRGQLVAIESVIPQAESALRVLENRLDVLAGRAPDGEYLTEASPLSLPSETKLPHIGVPVDLLQYRPDLRALQRRVVAADHRVAAAMAERLPRVTLDGSSFYGENSETATLSFNGAIGLLQPLFDWGIREAAVRGARSQTREAIMAYSEAYLVALEEVENALWREARQRERIAALARRETILERTLEETRVRYGLGVTDYLPVLTAVQDLQDLERELLAERRALVSIHIELYRATGGAATPLPHARTAIAETLAKE